jgi:hypothetical protein
LNYADERLKAEFLSLPAFGADVGSAHLEHIHKFKNWRSRFLPLNLGQKT